jgi:hypothetical protein
MARWRSGSWVATPVGQAPVWQDCAWMQPIANMKPRAALHQSAPSASTRAMSKAEVILPLTHRSGSGRAGRRRPRALCDEGQAVAQRHADMVHEFQRGRAGAALLAVDHDEIRRDPGVEHGLADRHETPTDDRCTA